MIQSITQHIDLPDFEQIMAVGLADPSTPLSALLVRADLTTEQQAVYDAAIDLVDDFKYTKIENTVAELSIDRITSIAIDDEQEEVLDFDTMTVADQDKLRDLLALLIELNQIV